jgi:hypothetical protein
MKRTFDVFEEPCDVVEADARLQSPEIASLDPEGFSRA